MDRFGNFESTPIDEVASWSRADIYASLRARPEIHEGPAIMAAGLEDSARLQFLLERAQLLPEKTRSETVVNFVRWPEHWGGMELPSPLLRTVERSRPENVKLLLSYGANPNGVPLERQIQLARLHRRFTTRPHLHPAELDHPLTAGNVGSVASQFLQVTEEELAERRSTVCRFWTEPHLDGIDYEAYAMLEGHPQLDIAIRTPVFHVHILHFAVALLSEKALETFKVSLTTAGATSIGHTLLHIACLPYREEEIAWCSKIQESIHETRNLNDSRFRRATPQSVSFDPNGKKEITPSDDMPDRASRDVVDELHRQEAICKRGIDALGVDLIASVDCHKNTALHYLAGS